MREKDVTLALLYQGGKPTTNNIGTGIIQPALLANFIYRAQYQVLNSRIDNVAERAVKRTVDAPDVVVIRTFPSIIFRRGWRID